MHSVPTVTDARRLITDLKDYSPMGVSIGNTDADKAHLLIACPTSPPHVAAIPLESMLAWVREAARQAEVDRLIRAKASGFDRILNRRNMYAALPVQVEALANRVLDRHTIAEADAAALKRLRAVLGFGSMVEQASAAVVVDRALERIAASPAARAEQRVADALAEVSATLGLPSWKTLADVAEAAAKHIKRRDGSHRAAKEALEKLDAAEKGLANATEGHANVRRRIIDLATVAGIPAPERFSSSGALLYAIGRAFQDQPTYVGYDLAGQPVARKGAPPATGLQGMGSFDLTANGMPVAVGDFEMRLRATHDPAERLTARVEVVVRRTGDTTRYIGVTLKLPCTTGLEIINHQWATGSTVNGGMIGTVAFTDIAATWVSRKGKARNGITYVLDAYRPVRVPLS
jgi:hypothetical protein